MKKIIAMLLAVMMVLAMVACAAYYKYKSGQKGSLDMDASPSMAL